MRGSFVIMWQIFFATILISSSAFAEIDIYTQPSGEAISINGLSQFEKNQLLLKPQNILLQLEKNLPGPSMLFDIELNDNTLLIKPEFSLIKGSLYKLSIQISEQDIFEKNIIIVPKKLSTPKLLGLHPNTKTIPANILRVYLSFSEPMARNQVRDKIFLSNAQGQRIDNPFLNLQAELWNNKQTRLTLLLDPGRIKQGVGPNVSDGAPLKAGKTYSLNISKSFKSAAGQPLEKLQSIDFTVGTAQRKKINPYDWHLNTPIYNTKSTLIVTFDRLIDIGTSSHFLRIVDNNNNEVQGHSTHNEKTWKFTPKNPWRSSVYSIIVSPELEDVSGNTITAPFDALAGTMKVDRNFAKVSFKPITNNQ